MQLARTCLSRDLKHFSSRTELNANFEDGTVWYDLVEDGPGLPEPDILGMFEGFVQF